MKNKKQKDVVYVYLTHDDIRFLTAAAKVFKDETYHTFQLKIEKGYDGYRITELNIWDYIYFCYRFDFIKKQEVK